MTTVRMVLTIIDEIGEPTRTYLQSERIFRAEEEEHYPKYKQLSLEELLEAISESNKYARGIRILHRIIDIDELDTINLEF